MKNKRALYAKVELMSTHRKKVAEMDTKTRTLVMEFPPETTELIYKLAENLHLEPTEVVSRALGLMEVWDEANRNDRIIVERPSRGGGQEFRLQVR